MAEKDDLELDDDIQPQGKSKLIIIIVVVNVVLLGGAGAFFVLSGGDEASAQEKPANPEEDMMAAMSGPPTLVKVNPFIVNLNDPGGSRYLKLAMEVEVPGEKGSEIVTKRMAPVRSRVISYLSGLTFADTQGTKHKRDLEKNLSKEINEELKGEVVKNVYFTEFVIQ